MRRGGSSADPRPRYATARAVTPGVVSTPAITGVPSPPRIRSLGCGRFGGAPTNRAQDAGGVGGCNVRDAARASPTARPGLHSPRGLPAMPRRAITPARRVVGTSPASNASFSHGRVGGTSAIAPVSLIVGSLALGASALRSIVTQEALLGFGAAVARTSLEHVPFVGSPCARPTTLRGGVAVSQGRPSTSLTGVGVARAAIWLRGVPVLARLVVRRATRCVGPFIHAR